MPEFPKRTEHTNWWNDSHISDIHEALSLLGRDNSSTEPMHLYHSFESGDALWEIREPWYREGSSGADTGGTNYFQLDQEIAKQLQSEGLVEPRRIPQMGYTVTRESELVLSNKGRQQLDDFLVEMRKKAEGMLVPGIHTDLTAEICSRGYGRDHTWYGSLYFRFDLPEERGMCQVYPELGTIVIPDDTTQAA